MTDYKMLTKQILALAEDEPFFVPVLSNASALLYENIEDINWVGFYIMDKGSLVLGPFQGKVACIRIPMGRGVCGTAAANDKTLLVPDVHKFAGHIACDGASNSEIVIPMHCHGKVVGVLDIDSPSLDRFKFEDQAGLEYFIKEMEQVTDFCRFGDALFEENGTLI
jgi:GAF domain-containing protein